MAQPTIRKTLPPAITWRSKDTDKVLGFRWSVHVYFSIVVFSHAAVQVKSRRSATRSPGKAGKRSIPLLNRIQMDQNECDDLGLTTRNAAQAERPLIDRVEIAPDDMNGQIYRPTTPTQDRPGSDWISMGSEYRNGRFSDVNLSGSVCNYSVFSTFVSLHSWQDLWYTQEHGVNHKRRKLGDRQNTSYSQESSAYKQHNSREGSKDLGDLRSQSSAATISHGDNVIIPNPDGGHGVRSPSVHHDNQASSVTSKAFFDHFLPLAQRIADGRMENSQVGTLSNGAALNSSVITAEVLAQFSQQLINLSKELHQQQHHESNGERISPIEEAQGTTSADGTESRVPGLSLNGSDNHPPVFEETIPHAPSDMAPPPPRTPTPEYREKRRRSSLVSPLLHMSPTDHTPRDSSYSSSELRRMSKDFTPYDYRTDRRSVDHYDHRQRPSNRREDSDRRYRRSISPRRRKTPYSPSQRRNSSPARYHRSPPSPHRQRRRSPHSPERIPRSSEKANCSSIPPKYIDSVPNHIKEPESHMYRDGLQDLLENHRGILSSRQGTRTVSELNVPGVWFAFRGSQDIGMSTIEFEFDDQTAEKWNLQSNKYENSISEMFLDLCRSRNYTTPEGTPSSSDDQSRLQPSLEIFCFSLNDVQMALQNLARDTKPDDLVKALSSLKNTWPLQGHLIVSINADSQNQKFWFPDTFVGDSVWY